MYSFLNPPRARSNSHGVTSLGLMGIGVISQEQSRTLQKGGEGGPAHGYFGNAFESSVEFDVTTAEGPSRVTVVTGKMQISLGALNGIAQSGSFKALLDPTLTAGQFRKAAAIVSLSNIVHTDNTGGASLTTRWTIDDAQATYDDEAGQVQLVIDATVLSDTVPSSAQLESLTFQVTTLARV